MRVPGSAVHPTPKGFPSKTKGRRGGGVRVELSSFPAYHEQRRGGQQGGRRGLRASSGRARAATWRSSVPEEGGNNNCQRGGVKAHRALLEHHLDAHRAQRRSRIVTDSKSRGKYPKKPRRFCLVAICKTTRSFGVYAPIGTIIGGN